MNVIIWGYGFWGAKLYTRIASDKRYSFMGFADNNPYKQKYTVNSNPVYSLQQLVKLNEQAEFQIIIASGAWAKIGKQIEEAGLKIAGIYNGKEVLSYKQLHFKDIDLSKDITLYAGDICDEHHLSQENLYGLSINKGDDRHILHDVTLPYPLPNDSIAAYQAEDVFEHIEYEKMIGVINEVYRVLKPGGVLRMSFPDYNSPLLSSLALRNEEGNILYDPLGGGDYKGVVINGGHLWFPTYQLVKEMLEKTLFQDIRFLVYHTKEKCLVMKEFDYKNGWVNRVQKDKEVYSMVIDCHK